MCADRTQSTPSANPGGRPRWHFLCLAGRRGPHGERIQIYGADWCGLTRELREYLTNSRFDYDYLDIDRNDGVQRFVLHLNDGHRRFPMWSCSIESSHNQRLRSCSA